jgi:hypothetical protein
VLASRVMQKPRAVQPAHVRCLPGEDLAVVTAGLLTELGMPALDAASKDAARLAGGNTEVVTEKIGGEAFVR